MHLIYVSLYKNEYTLITKKTSTSPKGEEVGPGIKQLLGKAQLDPEVQ